MPIRPPDQPAQIVARVTVAALRSLAEAAPFVRRDRTILNGRSLSLQETIDVLAAQPKPVKCSVAMESDVLVITAKPMTDAKELRRWQLVNELVDDNHEYIRRVYGKGEGFALLVEDKNGGFTIDDAIFDQWERQYEIPGIAYAVTGETSELRSVQAAAIVRFWPASRDKIQVRIEFQERP